MGKHNAGVGRTQGRKPTYDRKYEIQNMWERHHEIVRLTLLGHAPKDIAERLKITPQTVSITLNSKIVRDKLEIMRAQRDAASVSVAQAIQDLAPKAIAMVDKILESELGAVSPAVQLGAAKDILDRSGHKPAEKVQHMHAHLTAEEIEQIKERALANGLRQGKIVQVEEAQDAEYDEE